VKSWLIAATLLGILAAPAGHGSTNQTRVDVVVDMTREGRKLQPPSPGNPAYYLPLVRGYREMGKTVAGTTPPPAVGVVHQIAVELAKQGYLVVSKDVSTPSLILLIQWGSLNPEIGNFDPGNDPRQKYFFNERQMLALVGGNTLEHMDLDFERETVMQGAEEDRYFVALSAFDFKTYVSKHKKVLLWEAKMSLPSTGVTIDGALPALILAGGPLFGRETTRPKMLILPITPEGRVDIGTLTVKGYQDAPYPPAPASAPAGSQPPDAKR
jgi:hypothetical protein